MLPIFPYPTLESCSGGVPKHTPHPVFGRCPDSTQLWGSLPASLFRRVFPSFLSPPIRISLTGLHMLQATLQLSFSVSGRAGPTVGPGHSPQLNPSHLGGITPTLPISLLKGVFLGFSEFRGDLTVLQVNEVFCNNLPSFGWVYSTPGVEQNFSPITYLSKGIRWLLCECKLVTILIRIKAAVWRFNQLDYCVLPREAVYWSFTVPREIP